MDRIRCMINDKPYEIAGLPPTLSLLHYLRDVLHLTGTKEGCNEGDCGACTVVFRDDTGETPRYRTCNSCLIYLPMLHGKRIYTIEGLAQNNTRHPVQDAILTHYASQCGYCTPGVAMSLFEATYRHDMTKPWQFVEQMAGNLCRCTGYRPIMECVREVAGTGHSDHFTKALEEPALPVETLDYVHEDYEFYLPVTLAEALAFKAQHPEACVVSGASDVGVILNKNMGTPRKCFLGLCNIRELRKLDEDASTIHIGATARLGDVELYCQERIPALGRMLRYFAAHQIKQVSCIGGSISGASPVSDMAPIMMALNADVCVSSVRGTRKLKMDEFIQGYRKTAMMPDEIVTGFDVPRVDERVRCASYKVSKRQELDISSCSACFYVETDENNIVTVARFAYGGMAATAGARASKAEAAIVGKAWTEENVDTAAEKIAEDFSPLSDFRASAWYRSTVAANLLRGFYAETLNERQPQRMYRPTSTIQLEV